MVKALVIISSSDVDKALTGMLWATNALKRGWAEDVELIFFGPIEAEIARGNQRLLEAIAAYSQVKGTPLACKRVAEQGGFEEALKDKVRVEYVGAKIAELLGKGYTPLVF
ncbi:conserved hypothetical protein [Aeropyrum pernix K1]|uniref:DsrE/DsrF-like family protein n=1 Tax=Aeropyrum pernix (strain ATCC 700893 / DSM 11879 / JCM 9820 / NBRC 100138 / K1) TaxID=272557 RepID=Q9YBN0_AERPE|nr:conserved hypothetical protein [Aeropyrum pernix K1]